MDKTTWEETTTCSILNKYQTQLMQTKIKQEEEEEVMIVQLEICCRLQSDEVTFEMRRHENDIMDMPHATCHYMIGLIAEPYRDVDDLPLQKQ